MSEEVLNETPFPGEGNVKNVTESMSSNDEDALWYAVHTYSGYEKKVKLDLEKRRKSMKMDHKILEILIPEEKTFIFKDGKRKEITRQLYPGYVLVKMINEPDSWLVVHHTPGVTGFVGADNKTPIPLEPDEVTRILEFMGLCEKPKPVIDAEIGDKIRIISGPFENFEGVVLGIDSTRGKLKVSISMFERETAIELEYEQIEKL